MTQKPTPARIIPPYNILLRSIIAKFAEGSGISLDTLDDLKNEQMAITEELATKIHSALGDDSPSVEFWLTLQSNYEKHKLEEFQKKVQAAEEARAAWEEQKIEEVNEAIQLLKEECLYYVAEEDHVAEERWEGIECASVTKLPPEPSDFGKESIEVSLIGVEGWDAKFFFCKLGSKLWDFGMVAAHLYKD